MLEQAAWIAGIVAAVAAVLALYIKANRRSVQSTDQTVKIKGEGNSIRQVASNTTKKSDK